MSEHGTGVSEGWTAIVTIAQDMLDGRMELIAGVRVIRVVGGNEGVLSDAAIVPLVEADSETKHLPRGESRRFYAEESLQLTDAEAAAYLTRRKEFILNACRELVAAHS
jgi:hypothetical protein